MPDLIAAIKEELARQGRTPYWLAKQTGVSPKHIYRMLGGQLSRGNAEKMLDALNVVTEHDTGAGVTNRKKR